MKKWVCKIFGHDPIEWARQVRCGRCKETLLYNNSKGKWE